MSTNGHSATAYRAKDVDRVRSEFGFAGLLRRPRESFRYVACRACTCGSGVA